MENLTVKWDPMAEVMRVWFKPVGGEEQFRMFVMK